MKKKYIKPQFKVVQIEYHRILCASGRHFDIDAMP